MGGSGRGSLQACQADSTSANHNAPVQASGEHDSKAADVWACGVLLHHMLTGRAPDLDGHDYAPPARAPAECRGLLRSMLRASPADRASIFDIMQSPWFLQDCPEARRHLSSQSLHHPAQAPELTSNKPKTALVEPA